MKKQKDMVSGGQIRIENLKVPIEVLH